VGCFFFKKTNRFFSTLSTVQLYQVIVRSFAVPLLRKWSFLKFSTCFKCKFLAVKLSYSYETIQNRKKRHYMQSYRKKFTQMKNQLACWQENKTICIVVQMKRMKGTSNIQEFPTNLWDQFISNNWCRDVFSLAKWYFCKKKQALFDNCQLMQSYKNKVIVKMFKQSTVIMRKEYKNLATNNVKCK